jgi:hypothetical protein
MGKAKPKKPLKSESDLVKKVGGNSFVGVEGIRTLFKGTRYEKFVEKLIGFDPDLVDGLTIRRLDPSSRPDKADRSWYLPNTHSIELHSHADERILLHELLHGLTSRVINKGVYGFEGLNYKADIEAAVKLSSTPKSTRRILQLYLDTLNHWMQKNPDADLSKLGTTDVSSADLPKEIPYGLLTIDEFIAEAFSSKKFQNFLESIEVEKGKSLFDKLINTIREIFGFEIKDGTMLKEVIRATEGVLSDTSSRNPPEMERIPDDVWEAVAEAEMAKLPPNYSPPSKAPDPVAQAKQLETDLRAAQEETVKAAEARRAEKRKKVEESAKAFAPDKKGMTARNLDRVGRMTDQWFPWLSKRSNDYNSAADDFRGYVESLINDVAEGEDLSKLTAAELLARVDDSKLDYSRKVMLDLLETKKNYAKVRGIGNNYLKPNRGESNAVAHIDPATTGNENMSREILRLQLLVEKNDLTQAEAAQEFRDYVDMYETGEILSKLHNEAVQRRHDRQLAELGTPKLKLKYLKTFQDGLNRRGINLRGSSVNDSINAQITISQAPLMQVLVKHKMVDAFLKEEELIKGLMSAKRTGEIPTEWKGGEQEAIFKEILEVYKMTNESLIAELNQYGANIMYREDHSGVSYRWDGSTLASRGFTEFRKDMLEHVDWGRVETNMGGVMVTERNAHDFAQKFTKFNREKYIKGMYEDLTKPRDPDDHPSMDIARSFGKHRHVALKDDSEIYMMKKYSGHENMGQLYLDQIRYRSEMVAIARELGNNPIPNFRQMVEDAGLKREVNTTREGKRFGKKLHELDMASMEWTLQHMTGRLDNPVDVDLARYSKTLRQVSHMLYLWTSGVSAITDIPLTISTLQQLGVTNSTTELTRAFTKSFKRRVLKDSENTRQFYTAMGANFDGMMNAASRHLGLPDSKTAGSLISRMSDAVFSLNGLNQWTGIMQEAFFDVLSKEMAEGIKAGKLDASMLRSLEAAGLTEADVLSMGDSITNLIDGVDRFDVQTLDGDTQRKMMAFFAKYRDEAIMVPDASTLGMVRAGTQAGTIKGEAMRVFFQYQAFPLAMNRVSARKFLVNAAGDRPWTTDQVTLSRMVGFIGGMLATAYVATVIKDLLRGREPMHPGNMTASSWLRIVNQSGVGGLLQSAMEVGSGNPKSLLAPLPSDTLKIAASDSFGEAIYRSRNLWSGGNNPAAPLIQKMVAAVFPDMVGVHFKMLNAYHEQNTGQSPLFWAPSP